MGAQNAKKKSPGNDTSSSCNSSEPNSPNVFNTKFKKFLNEPDATAPRSTLNPYYEKDHSQQQASQSISKGGSIYSDESGFDSTVDSAYINDLRTRREGSIQNNNANNPEDLTRTITSESSTLPDESLSNEPPGSSGVATNINDNPNFNIAYEQITEKNEIGRGRFGVVYEASWHGQHAIKEIEFDERFSKDESVMRNINEEVANLRKTRHSNLILYVGACIQPNKCAIVMTLCRGMSLFKTIHMESFARINIDWIINIAINIAQGMAYLHSKQIIHKDLRSKNVFIDGHKTVISDFGLFSITSLSKTTRKNQCLPLTKECLYYMSPELVRAIGRSEIVQVFSKLSDVYAFGTILFEMFCKDFPFSTYHTETILYMMGHSYKSLPPVIQIPKDFKVILLSCWSKEVANRPSFSSLLETFRNVPKQCKLFRSPSHPLSIGGRVG